MADRTDELPHRGKRGHTGEIKGIYRERELEREREKIRAMESAEGLLGFCFSQKNDRAKFKFPSHVLIFA